MSRKCAAVVVALVLTTLGTADTSAQQAVLKKFAAPTAPAALSLPTTTKYGAAVKLPSPPTAGTASGYVSGTIRLDPTDGEPRGTAGQLEVRLYLTRAGFANTPVGTPVPISVSAGQTVWHFKNLRVPAGLTVNIEARYTGAWSPIAYGACQLVTGTTALTVAVGESVTRDFKLYGVPGRPVIRPQ